MLAELRNRVLWFLGTPACNRGVSRLMGLRGLVGSGVIGFMAGLGPKGVCLRSL